MKRILPALFLLFTMNVSFAQTYKCFVPTVKQYFTNNYGYLRGMQIDSIAQADTNSNNWAYYPFHTPRGVSTLDSNGGSWLGRKILLTPDGTFLFGTIWKDTAVIKTMANVGDSWIFHNDSSNRHYMATLSSMDVMTFAGHTDSVKRITITAYENNTLNPADSFDGTEIILSKNYGFAQTIDLYIFPYHPYNSDTISKDYYFKRSITNPFDLLPGNQLPNPFPSTTAPGKYNTTFRQISFVNPTVAQVASGLDIGDILMYNTCEDLTSFCPSNTPYECHMDTITQKTVTAAKTTYTFHGVAATFADTNFYVLSPETGTFNYSDTTTIYNTALMPEEMRQSNFMYYYPEDMTYCRPGLMTLQVYNQIRTNLTITPNTKVYKIYKTGIGITKSYNYANPDVKDTTVNYVKAANIPCGSNVVTPYTLSASGKNMKEGVKVYPNPASNFLFVELNDDKEAAIAVINITGQTVIRQQANGARTQIDISRLSPGIYTISIRSKDGTAYAKFVKSE